MTRHAPPLRNSVYDAPLHRVQIGGRVSWWTRRAGHAPVQRFGQVVSLDPWFAHIREDRGDDRTRVVSVRRLKPEPAV